MAVIIDARVFQKKDTLANWMANPLILGPGEQAFVINTTGAPVNFRVGDGTKRFSDLPDWIQYAANLVVDTTAPGGALPTGLSAGKITFLQPGTYTNTTGTLVVPASSLGIAFWNGTIWSLTNFSVTASTSLTIWSASAFATGVQVVYNGQLYRANATTLSTDIPGVSTKWTSLIDKDVVNRHYPYSDTITIDAIPVDLREFILDIEIYLDPTHQYYVSYIGNYYTSGANKINYFQISDVATSTKVAGYGDFSGAIIVTSQSTGVELLTLYGSTGSIVGYALVNWDKCYPAGGRSGTLTSAQGLLSKSVNYNKNFSSDKNQFSKEPFGPTATFNKDFPDWYKAIEKIELYGADPTKRYYLKTFARKRTANNFYYFIIEVEGGVATTGVCYYNTALTENTTGVNVITLAATSGSGITGKVWIDYSRVTTLANTALLSATISQSVLSSSVHVVSSSSSNFSEANDRLVVGDTLYLVDEDNLQFSKNRMIASENYQGELGLIQSSAERYALPDYFKHTLRIKNAEHTDGRSCRIFNKMYGNPTMYLKDVLIKKTTRGTLAGKQASIILFGDSITDGVSPEQAVTPYVGANLAIWGALPIFRGLKSDDIYPNEGRSSWEFANIIGLNTSNFHEVPTDSNTNSNTAQPFIKVATSGQLAANPTWCFENTPSTNGGVSGVAREKDYIASQSAGGYTGQYYTFDFARYANLNLGGIDAGLKLIVCFALGFNDLNHNSKSAQSKADVQLAMEIVYNRVKQYRSDAIIGFAPIVAVNEDNQWSEFANMIELAMLKASALGADIVPVWQHVEPYSVFKYDVQSALSAQNNSKKATTADLVHPWIWGTRQYAAVVSNWIASKL